MDRAALDVAHAAAVRYLEGMADRAVGAWSVRAAFDGPLPEEFELATVYSVAATANAREPALARQFAQMIAGPANRSVRERAGFE